MRVVRIGTNLFIFPQKLGKLYNILELFNAKSNTLSFCGETSPKWQLYFRPKPNVHILFKVQLVESEQLDMATKRICLSYCWRSKQNTKL